MTSSSGRSHGRSNDHPPALRRVLRRSFAATALVVSGLLLWIAALAQAPTAGNATGQVVVLEVDGVIGPATADFVNRGLARARASGARLVVLRMDTPGGLDASMRVIIKDILASTVPVATFVAPEGARAASAGTYILYASHIAAMAPATNLGAATPVAIGAPGVPGPQKPAPGRPAGDDPPAKPAAKGGTDKGSSGKDANARAGAEKAGGEDDSGPADAMTAKAVNDAAAYLRSLAQLRGRNADFAEKAVRRASSLSAKEALEGGVIDLIAADVADLLRKVDGREIKLPNATARLEVAGAPIEIVAPGWRSKLLSVLSNPTLAVVLLMIGIYGLFVEFTSPGFGVPGVAGAICLLLGIYALQLLPVNWVGFGLLMLGSVLMVAELFLPSFGVLGVGGIIAFIVGGLMLIDTDAAGFGLPPAVVVAAALTSATVILGFGSFALKARRRRVVSGREEMIGALGTVEAVDADELRIRVHGESWRARRDAGAPLAVGQPVQVSAIDGLTLQVRPAGNPSEEDDRR